MQRSNKNDDDSLSASLKANGALVVVNGFTRISKKVKVKEKSEIERMCVYMFHRYSIMG